MKWDTTVLAALIGAVVTLIVTIITTVITIRGWQEEYRRAIEQRKSEARLQRLQSQIEELYGPLWGLNQQSNIIYKTATKLLPSVKGKIRIDKFNTDEEERIWHFFVETYFLPLNAKKAELINTKSYLCNLLESGELPKSFENFLKHQAQGACLYQLGKMQKNFDSSLFKDFILAYPSEFDKDVKIYLDELRRNYSETLTLYKQSKIAKNDR
jgi:type II secretory pathway pseudopilin PulG